MPVHVQKTDNKREFSFPNIHFEVFKTINFREGVYEKKLSYLQ